MNDLDNILTGLVTINGKDIWSEFNAFLTEKDYAHVNMDALMRKSTAKDVTSVDFRERDGVELPANINIKLKAIERTLQFAIITDYEVERLNKYKDFVKMLTEGKLEVYIKNYGTYRMIYQDMPSNPEWYRCFSGHYATIFTIKFLDYEPF